MSNRKRTKQCMIETTGSDPGGERYPAWAALPLVLSFLRSSQTSRAEDRAWFSSQYSPQTLYPWPRAQCREKAGMPNPSAKLMQRKHDGGHTQSFYSSASAVLLPRLKMGLDGISSWPSLKCHIKQDGSKGWCQICVCYRKTLQSDLCVIESLKLEKRLVFCFSFGWNMRCCWKSSLIC